MNFKKSILTFIKQTQSSMSADEERKCLENLSEGEQCFLKHMDRLPGDVRTYVTKNFPFGSWNAPIIARKLKDTPKGMEVMFVFTEVVYNQTILRQMTLPYSCFTCESIRVMKLLLDVDVENPKVMRFSQSAIRAGKTYANHTIDDLDPMEDIL